MSEVNPAPSHAKPGHQRITVSLPNAIAEQVRKNALDHDRTLGGEAAHLIRSALQVSGAVQRPPENR